LKKNLNDKILNRSPEKNLLASGGNDNAIYLWDPKKMGVLFKLEGHEAAVKALAWNHYKNN